MKKFNIKVPAKVSRAAHKAGFKIKAHAPEILIGTGLLLIGAGTVSACKATRKLDAVLENAKFEIDAVHKAKEDGEIGIRNPETQEIELVPYTEEDHKKDLALVYARNGLQFAKLYGPAVAMGFAGAGCILASNNIIRKRNLALAAAYTTVDNAFKEYQGRVIERFGEELDKELKYNIKAKEIEETVTNEDGTEQVVKKTVNVVDGPITSPYTACFDETCPNWVKNAEDNKYFLMQVQKWANDRLQAKGYLFLNEVLEAIGVQETRAGSEVGWIYDKDNTIGDNYVDFGIFNIYSEPNRRFVNGYERSVWLEFNVDGPIQHILP
jgi:hypothetical protein